jgi:signal transduction histidine kinase
MNATAAQAASAAAGALRAGRRVVVGAITLLLICFLAGLAAWAAHADTLLARWSAPDGWSTEQVRATLADWGLPAAWFVGYFVFLELMLAVVSIAAAWFVLRGLASWFRLYVAFELVFFAVAGGGVPIVVGHVNPALADAGATLQGLAWISLFPIAYVFPDGRFVPRWTRWFAAGWVAYLAAAVTLPEQTPLRVVEPIVLLALFGSCAIAQIYRYAKVSGPVQRQQTKWVMTAVALRFALNVAYAATPLLTIQNETTPRGLAVYMTTMGLSYLIAAALPAAIAIAIVRHRLFDIDAVISRTLVYAVLTGFVIAVYAGVVAAAGALWPGDRTTAAPLIAAGVVAVVFNPVRGRVQHVVNRLVYGERDDPYGVLSQLGRRLAEIVEPGQVAATIVQSVARALKVPYAAIRFDADADDEVAAAAGRAVPVTEEFALTYQGHSLGRLIVGQRPGDRLTGTDRRLLADLADHSGAALLAAREATSTRRLAADLQHARERLVTAREEERRRIRRDLHDSLGPALGGQALTIDAASNLLRTDPDAATALLHDLKQQSRQILGDVRRLARQLRPPVLDELGLAAALEHLPDEYAHSGLQLIVTVDPLPDLPAAAEVAAYRIAREAVTNVARHAAATTCELVLAMGDGELRLSVTDDGQGIAAGTRAGVGTHSMRERAEELGGSLHIGPGPRGGTQLTAVIPAHTTGPQE